METETVLSRAVESWRLTFLYAAQVLHFLTRALLLSLASLGLGFAWLCCWVDRFRSGKEATAWIIPIFPDTQSDSALHGLTAIPKSLQPQPRTIDSLMRSKGARS